MPPVVDWSTVQTNNFEPIPNAIYDARLNKVDVVPAKASDKFPYYKCEFVLVGGEHDGRKFWSNLSQAPQSLWMFKTACLALGANEADLSAGSVMDTDDIIFPLVGGDCRLDIVEETYNGKQQSVINDRGILPVLAF